MTGTVPAAAIFFDLDGTLMDHGHASVQAARQIGRAPERCAHVGDSLENDALGARRAGMAGIWLNRVGATTAAVAGEIRSLGHLPPLVDGRFDPTA